MKIRTTFVTNSSSYSSAEIKIDNPVLLEILEKYRKLGAFIRDDNYDLGGCIGSSERRGKAEKITSYPWYGDAEEKLNELDDTPVAIYFYEDEQAEILFAPDSIEDIVNQILDVVVSEALTDYSSRQAVGVLTDNILQ